MSGEKKKKKSISEAKKCIVDYSFLLLISIPKPKAFQCTVFLLFNTHLLYQEKALSSQPLPQSSQLAASSCGSRIEYSAIYSTYLAESCECMLSCLLFEMCWTKVSHLVLKSSFTNCLYSYMLHAFFFVTYILSRASGRSGILYPLVPFIVQIFTKKWCWRNRDRTFRQLVQKKRPCNFLNSFCGWLNFSFISMTGSFNHFSSPHLLKLCTTLPTNMWTPVNTNVLLCWQEVKMGRFFARDSFLIHAQACAYRLSC